MQKSDHFYQGLNRLLTKNKINAALKHVSINMVNIVQQILDNDIIDDLLEIYCEEYKWKEIKRALEIVKKRNKESNLNNSTDKSSQSEQRFQYVLVNSQNLEEENFMPYFQEFYEICPSIVKSYYTQSWHQQAFGSILFLNGCDYWYLLDKFKARPLLILQKLMDQEYKTENHYKKDLKRLKSQVKELFGFNMPMSNQIIKITLSKLVYINND